MIGSPSPQEATAKYPTATLTVKTATQTLGSPNGTMLQAGPYSTPVPSGDPCTAATQECIWAGYLATQWQFSVAAPKEGAGQIAVAQILEQWEGSQNAAGNSANQCTSTSNSLGALNYFLDNGFPYPGTPPTSVAGGQNATWSGNDSPGMAWLYVRAEGDGNNVQAYRTGYFEDFYMYSQLLRRAEVVFGLR